MTTKMWIVPAAVAAASAPASALNIVPVFDSSVTGQAAAGAIESAFNTVLGDYAGAFSTPATVYINVGWGEVGGAALPSSAVGASSSNLYGFYTYNQVRSLLTAAAASNSADQTLALALKHLSSTAPSGTNRYVVTAAEAKALGLIAPATARTDGSVGFAGSTSSYSFDPTNVAAGQYDFQAVAAHEVSEVLGRSSGVGGGMWRTPLDLFRYSAPGSLSYSFGQNAYFSVDGGATALQQFNAAASGDRADWATGSASRDAFDASIGKGQRKALSAIDLAELDVLGWSGANVGNTGAMPTGTAFAVAGSVPEPAAWSLMILGFGLVGATARNQRQACA